MMGELTRWKGVVEPGGGIGEYLGCTEERDGLWVNQGTPSFAISGHKLGNDK